MSPSDVPSCPWCGSDSHYATNSVGCPVKFDERVSMPSDVTPSSEAGYTLRVEDTDWSYRRVLVRTSDGVEIAWDGGEPEDATFVRDYAPVVDELNNLEAELALLRAVTEEHHRACADQHGLMVELARLRDRLSVERLARACSSAWHIWARHPAHTEQYIGEAMGCANMGDQLAAAILAELAKQDKPEVEG